MILSVSRRTDIPAFYSNWFFNRLRAGFVYSINPFNHKQISRISLKPDDVDCIVFRTKNPEPMLDRPDEFREYKYFFQFTITPYDRDVEPGLLRDRLKRDLIRTFQKLSTLIGKDKVVWRYDPILLSEAGHSVDWHFDRFSKMLKALAPYTERGVISFLDLYRKTEHNTRPLDIRDITVEEMRELARGFSQIAEGSGIKIQSCSEKIDLSEFGIEHGACIDKTMIERMLGESIDIKKAPTQRLECGCVESADIRQYDTCPHLCAYCYANFRPQIAKTHYEHHDENSPLLFGELRGDERITDRKIKRLRRTQNELFGNVCSDAFEISRRQKDRRRVA